MKNSSLMQKLRSKEYRDAYVASQINIGIPFQIRALRKSRNWTQRNLASDAHMSQCRISKLETPGSGPFNVRTLLRIAAAFDIGLQVRFIAFDELMEWDELFYPDNFEIKSFDPYLD